MINQFQSYLDTFMLWIEQLTELFAKLVETAGNASTLLATAEEFINEIMALGATFFSLFQTLSAAVQAILSVFSA